MCTSLKYIAQLAGSLVGSAKDILELDAFRQRITDFERSHLEQYVLEY
jgi:hypothetical protein